MLGSIGIAVVMGSPMFLLFGAVGVLASLGMWVAGRIGAARDGRRAGACRAREVAAFAAAVREQRAARWQHHVATTPSVAEADRRRHDAAGRPVGRAGPTTTTRSGVTPRVGRRRVGGRRSTTRRWARPGPSRASWPASSPPPSASTTPPSPSTSAPAPPSPSGAPARRPSPARSSSSWRRGSVRPTGASSSSSTTRARGTGAAGCPTPRRAAGPSSSRGRRRRAGRRGPGPAARRRPRHVVVVTDRPDLLAQRTGPLRRFVGAAPSVAVVVVVGPGDAVAGDVPQRARRSARSASPAGGRTPRWPTGPSPSTRPGVPRGDGDRRRPRARRAPRPGGPAPRRRRAARRRSASARSACEHGVGPIDDAIAIAAAWRSAGDDPPPVAVLGLDRRRGRRDRPRPRRPARARRRHDRVGQERAAADARRRRWPHGASPDHLTFVLVDYKGGSTFDACADLPHTVGVVTDLDDRLAERALVSLEAEIRRRERLLRAAGAADLAEYRAGARADRRCPGSSSSSTSSPPSPPSCRRSCRRSSASPSAGAASASTSCWPRSARPAWSATTSGPTRTCAWRCGCRTSPTPATSSATTARPRSPGARPGRAMLRLGPGETVVFQSAHSTGPVTVSAARRAARRRRRRRPARPSGADGTELAVLVGSIRHAAALSRHRAAPPAVAAAAADGPRPRRSLDRLAPGRARSGSSTCRPSSAGDPLRWRPADGVAGARSAAAGRGRRRRWSRSSSPPAPTTPADERPRLRHRRPRRRSARRARRARELRRRRAPARARAPRAAAAAARRRDRPTSVDGRPAGVARTSSSPSTGCPSCGPPSTRPTDGRPVRAAAAGRHRGGRGRASCAS